MYESQPTLTWARRCGAHEAACAGVDALIASVDQLVREGWTLAAPASQSSRTFWRFRDELESVLTSERIHLDAAVHGQASVVVDRMHEAALELDLARLLGPHDARGREAMSRAWGAVRREGPALQRALEHLAHRASRPPAHLRLVPPS